MSDKIFNLRDYPKPVPKTDPPGFPEIEARLGRIEKTMRMLETHILLIVCGTAGLLVLATIDALKAQ